MIAVTGMSDFSSLDLGPSRMAGSFAASVASRLEVAPVDVLIVVKLLYLNDLALTPINHLRAAISMVLRTCLS
jgi:hypothetical protein